MTPAFIAAMLVIVALTSSLVVLVVPADARRTASGMSTAVIGALAIWLGCGTVTSGFAPVRMGWLLPLSGATFAGDGTSALFTVVTGAVAVVAGVFGIGYARDSHLPTSAHVALPLFVSAMALVPFAASVTTFLFVWEAMALTSLLLVLAEHSLRPTREAGVIYAVMTQVGFATILLGLVVFAAAAHDETFAAMHTARVPMGVRGIVFVLTVIGFGSKAGLVPLHPWLPHAHPVAPSPASALMSASMVNLGIYGIVRVDLQLLGPGPSWWGLLLLVAGAVTAVYAVLQASVAIQLKRLLAYSTSENMGLVMLALGAAMLLSRAGSRAVALLALTAALLHVINHAAFKTLAFLAAGSVLSRTRTRNLDDLGGLATTMPVTTIFFGIAALGAAGLPLGAGFVSEWLLLQSLIHTLPAGGTMLALTMPVAVAAVALTAGLAVATMVKAFGVGFLARPRSAGAASAREVSRGMLLAMFVPAIGCAVLAVAPAVVEPLLRDTVQTFSRSNARSASSPALGLILRLPGLGGSMSPALLAAALVVAVLLATGLSYTQSFRRRAARPTPLWACGGGPLTPRMQYTATSFAEPLQRVFDDVLRPDIDIDVTHYDESRYLVEKVRYTASVGDAIETRVYLPLLHALTAVAHVVRRLHNGSVHAYLGYGALGLLVALMVAR